MGSRTTRPTIGVPELIPPGPVGPAGVGFPVLSIQELIAELRSLNARIDTVISVYTKAGSRVEIRQYQLGDIAKYTRIINLASDVLSWELWNSDLGILGDLQWAYVSNPGDAPNGQFNKITSGTRIVRAVAGVDLYVKPQLANQIVVLEVIQK